MKFKRLKENKDQSKNDITVTMEATKPEAKDIDTALENERKNNKKRYDQSMKETTPTDLPKEPKEEKPVNVYKVVMEGYDYKKDDKDNFTVNIKSRAELSKLIENLKINNIKHRISRSVKEGYRYEVSFKNKLLKEGVTFGITNKNADELFKDKDVVNWKKGYTIEREKDEDGEYVYELYHNGIYVYSADDIESIFKYIDEDKYESLKEYWDDEQGDDFGYNKYPNLTFKYEVHAVDDKDEDKVYKEFTNKQQAVKYAKNNKIKCFIDEVTYSKNDDFVQSDTIYGPADLEESARKHQIDLDGDKIIIDGESYQLLDSNETYFLYKDEQGNWQEIRKDGTFDTERYASDYFDESLKEEQNIKLGKRFGKLLLPPKSKPRPRYVYEVYWYDNEEWDGDPIFKKFPSNKARELWVKQHENDPDKFGMCDDLPGYNVNESVKHNIKRKPIAEDVSKANEIESAVREGVVEFFKKKGWEDDDIQDFTRVEVTDKDNAYVVEIGAEVGYNTLSKLMDALNPIVAKYNKDSYFDAEDAGIASSHIWKKGMLKENTKQSLTEDPVQDRLDELRKISRQRQLNDDEVRELAQLSSKKNEGVEPLKEKDDKKKKPSRRPTRFVGDEEKEIEFFNNANGVSTGAPVCESDEDDDVEDIIDDDLIFDDEDDNIIDDDDVIINDEDEVEDDDIDALDILKDKLDVHGEEDGEITIVKKGDLDKKKAPKLKIEVEEDEYDTLKDEFCDDDNEGEKEDEKAENNLDVEGDDEYDFSGIKNIQYVDSAKEQEQKQELEEKALAKAQNENASIVEKLKQANNLDDEDVVLEESADDVSAFSSLL